MYLKLKSIQNTLNKEPLLLLEKYPQEFSFGDWELKDFVLQFLVSLSSETNTLIASTKKVFCKPAKRRSIADIYNLCRYYYDNVTFAEVQCALASLWKEKKIGFFYCNSTKRRVYMSLEYYNTHTVNPVQYAEPDEWNIPVNEMTKLSKTDYTTLITE